MPCVGKRLYLALYAGPIFDEAHKPIAVVEMVCDMPEQKLAQTDETLDTCWLRAGANAVERHVRSPARRRMLEDCRHDHRRFGQPI
jgi:hypothetical protein